MLLRNNKRNDRIITKKFHMNFLEIKFLLCNPFLKSNQDVGKYDWYFMFLNPFLHKFRKLNCDMKLGSYKTYVVFNFHTLT